MIRKLASILLACAPSLLTSQTTTFSSTIAPPAGDGLHRIMLLPEHRALLAADMRDLRVLDSSGSEVPYYLLQEPPVTPATQFVPYRIVSQKYTRSQAITIVTNESGKPINNIAFEVSNSDAYKTCVVDGSNNLKEWFSISSGKPFVLDYNELHTSVYKHLYFRTSDYRYYRITLFDSLTAPVRIISAGTFINSTVMGRLIEVAHEHEVSNNAKQKTSVIRLKLNGRQPVHRVTLEVAGPRLYQRTATAYCTEMITVRKKETLSKRMLASAVLQAGKPLVVKLPGTPLNEFEIEIANGDSPPLQITDITCLQQPVYLICDLDKGRPYTLTGGDASLKTPSYDIAGLANNVAETLPEAVAGPVVKTGPGEAISAKPAGTSFISSKSFMWLCIAVTGVMLAYFSSQLISSIKKQGNA